MPVSMMAIYRRPEGGEEALEIFRRRYAEEHLPLIREVPGLRSIRVERIAHAFNETDIVMIAELMFDNRAALDAGMASDQMRAAARNLREIAPGLATVLVLEPEPLTPTTGSSTVLDVLLESEEDPAQQPSGASLDAGFGRPEDDK